MKDYKTTWGEKIGYGIGAVGLDLSYGLFYSFLRNSQAVLSNHSLSVKCAWA